MAITLITSGKPSGGRPRLVGHVGDPLGRIRCPYAPTLNVHRVQAEIWSTSGYVVWAKMVPGTRIRGRMFGNVRIWICQYCQKRLET